VAIIVNCECGQTFETRDENAGRRAKCPVCGRELVVPSASKGAPVPEMPEFTPLESATSGKAIASLVLGLLSLVLCLLTGVPAIILGSLGLSDISNSKGRLGGRGLAIAGISLGAVGSTFVVFGVLIALLLPAVQAAREAARRAQCVNNLKQLALAMHNYHDTFNSFPPQATTDADGKPLLSWRVLLLPFLEQSALYDQFHLDEPWDSPANRPLADQMPQLFRCPSEPVNAPGLTHYEAIAGPSTLFPAPGESRRPIRLSDVIDGTSNTIAFVEAARPVVWTAPDDVSADTSDPFGGLGSRHPGGVNAALADGSIRFIKSSINPAVLRALITRNGGEVISGASY